jgi:catalase
MKFENTKDTTMEPKKKLTTASGRPYAENENSQTIGPRGPILLQDFILHEKMAHFNRERIPSVLYMLKALVLTVL